MTFSFSSLIRLLALGAVVATMTAVGLSKLDPPKPGRRTCGATRFFNVNEYFLDVTDRVPRWLDADLSEIVPCPSEDGDVFETASCSPWVDERGKSQLVGRWSSRTRDGALSVSNDFGLARYSFPGGELIDHVSTEIVPVTPPCWYPGTRARVLFAAGDGRIYHYAFEPEDWEKQADPEAKADARPIPMAWSCKIPGDGHLFVTDLTWPEDPSMAGCLLATIRERATNSQGVRVFTRTQLWWLKLDLAGKRILEMGQLLTPEDCEGNPTIFDVRCPSVGKLPDGRLALAYLIQNGIDPGWELRAVPIEFDGHRQNPRAVESESRSIHKSCQSSQPAFSTDGRWLNVLTGEDMKKGRVTRCSTAPLCEKSS